MPALMRYNRKIFRDCFCRFTRMVRGVGGALCGGVRQEGVLLLQA